MDFSDHILKKLKALNFSTSLAYILYLQRTSFALLNNLPHKKSDLHFRYFERIPMPVGRRSGAGRAPVGCRSGAGRVPVGCR